MTTLLDPNPLRAGSHRNMIEHLTAPFAAGALESEVAINASGVAAVADPTREPLLVVAPRAPLDRETLRLRATLPDGTVVDFLYSPYTEAGSFLPVYRPPASLTTGMAAPFSVKLELFARQPGQAEAAVPAADRAARLEARLIQGNMGRLVYLLGHEKQRLRREGRELAAMRLLSRARDLALDRFGADLAVPRLMDRIAFKSGAVVTETERESDADYRRRLRVYHELLQATPVRVLELLNGKSSTGANSGALGELGFAGRLSLVEEDDPFAVGIKLVQAGDTPYRDNFLAFIRKTFLLWPKTGASADGVHSARFLPPNRVKRDDDLRKGVRDHFSFQGSAANDPAMAPMLAMALIRAARCRKALGLTTKWPLTLAQSNTDGSRYELGLGADIEPFSSADLAAIAAKVPTAAPTDPEVKAMIASMKPPTTLGVDPEGRWFFEACGLRTAHRVDAGRLFVSHLPIFGTVVSGPTQVPQAGWTEVLPVGGWGANAILWYDRAAGEARFAQTDSYGNIITPTTLAGVRTTWSAIVPGQFTNDERANVALYDRAAGDLVFAAVDNTGFQVLKSYNGTWGNTWTHVAPLWLPQLGWHTGLLFYDKTNGVIETYTVTEGQATKVETLTGVSKGWTKIVPYVLEGGASQVLFYDPAKGEADIFGADEQGKLVQLDSFSGLRKTWTEIVPGLWGGSLLMEFLFYDRTNGDVEICTMGEAGFDVLNQIPDFGSWSLIRPGRFSSTGQYTDLLLYDRISGRGDLMEGTGDDELTLMHRYSDWQRGTANAFDAVLEAPGIPNSNVVLTTGLTDAATAWGGPAWTVLTPAQGSAARATADLRPATDPALATFAAVKLPLVQRQGPNPALPGVLTALDNLPPDLIATLRLAPAQAAQIVAGNAAAVGQLQTLLELLRVRRIGAAMPFVTAGGDVLLVVGVTGLPGIGLNLDDRVATGFRWYAVPIKGEGGSLKRVGSKTEYLPAGEGLVALVALGYARQRLTDPYEFRVDLPAGSFLDIRQYEFLMNVLEYACPAGVRVNTFDLRHGGVDLDGSGQPDPLGTTVSRTYRAFRRRRHRGETSVAVEES